MNITKIDFALLQLEAMQQVRRVLDDFYASFLGQATPVNTEEEEDGNLPGEETGYMGEDRPTNVW
jgi:hypothetical protein